MDIRLFDQYYVSKSGVDQFPKEEVEFELVAAKNDAVFASLLVCPDDYSTLSVGKNPAFSRRGIYENFRVEAFSDAPAVNVSCKIIGKVTDDVNVATSDVVLNQDYIEMERSLIGVGQQVMILCEVPKDAKAGTYTVTVKVYRSIGFAAEELVKSFSVPLRIYDVTLPDVREQKFHLDLWQHNANIARKHDVSLYSDEHFAVLESYVKSLAALGQNAVTVIASEIPWSGQSVFKVTNYMSDLYEYNMIRVTKKDGKFEYDYSAMQRYIDLCFANGIDREIEVFGLINIWVDPNYGYGKAYPEDPDGVRIRYYDADEGIFRYMDSNEQIADYISALEQYFVETDQIRYVQIVADEPADVEKYRTSLNRIHEAAPKFVYKVAINHIEFIEKFGDYISDIVPCLNFAAEKAEYLSARSKSGKGRTCLYVCCGPDYPNTFLSSPPYEAEVIGIFIHKIGIDGFLRWNYTVWPDDPRNKMAFRAPGWKAGDTNFVYPGYNGSVLLSLRWYHLKRAIMDYELLTRASDLAPEVVEQVYDTVFVDQDPAAFKVTSYAMVGNRLPQQLYSQNPADYHAVHKMLLEALEGK